MKTTFVAKVWLFILAAAIMAGMALAGDETQKEQKPFNDELPIFKAPVDDQAPVPVMNQIMNRGDKSGSVTKLPLDNLRARKFKTSDGKAGWKVEIPGNRALATPAVVDGMVYVGGGFGSYEFYAFDAESGEPKWAIKVSDDGPTAAVVADGVVAFNTESCTLFVVDAKTGRQLWSIWLGDPLMSQPAIADGKVFMAFPSRGGHQIIALDLKGGKEKWRAPIAGDIISAPVAYKDSVYISTFDGHVYRFRMRDGHEVWNKDFQATSAPWLYKDQVFVSQRKKGEEAPREAVLRMDNEKGAPNQSKGAWRERAALYLDAAVQNRSAYNAAQKSDDASVGFSSGPAAAKLGEAMANVGQGTVRGLWEYQGSRPCVYDGVLYMTQGDEVVALDPDSGKELWAKDLSGDLEKLGGHLGAPPSPAGEKLYLAAVTGEIIVLDKNRGAIRDTIEVGSPMRFQPALAKGRIYVGTTDGKLICLELGDRKADGWTMWGGSPSHNGE